MSVLDAVINPADLRVLDPAVIRKIELGVKAGAKASAAIEVRERFGANVKTLASSAKTSAAAFKKVLK